MISASRLLTRCFAFSTIIGFGGVLASNQQADRLPDPLTLAQAIVLAEQHPRVVQASARKAETVAAFADVGSGYRLKANVVGRLGYVYPLSSSTDQRHGDNAIELAVSKRLYDFGRRTAKIAAANRRIDASTLVYKDRLNQHRIAVMQQFFAVLLSDLRYIRDNEAMAIAYLRMDRSRKRHSLGQVAELQVLALASQYQRIRRERYASRQRQRASRAQLASLLDRPGELPAELVAPRLPHINQKVPAYDLLLNKAMANNMALRALRAQVQAAKLMVEAARAGVRPTIDAEIRLGEYQRSVGRPGDVRAAISVDIPLVSGGVVKAEVAKRLARLQYVEAQLREEELDVTQAVLENWQELEILRIKRAEMFALLDFRDMHLDRSRTEYEMEFQSDLGDAMVNISDAQLQIAETNYTLALTWAQLNHLTGQMVSNTPASAELVSQ